MAAFSIQLVTWEQAQSSLRRVREAVFIREQRVPVELEWDEWDLLATHALASDSAGQPIGTGRLLPDGHLGRMAVLAAWRKQGVGSALLHHLLAEAQRQKITTIKLNAQISAAAFYQKYAFKTMGEMFIEADIPHIKMQKTLAF